MNALATAADEMTVARHLKKQDRAIRSHGYGATAGALGLAQRYHQQLSSYIQQELLKNPEGLERENPEIGSLRRVLRQLDPDVIALSALHTALHEIAVETPSMVVVYSMLGTAIAGECWAAKLLQHDGKLAAKIERAVRQRHTSVKYRKQAARSIASKAGFRVRHWSSTQRILAGNVLVNWLLGGLPEVFSTVEVRGPKGPHHILTLTEGALEIALDAADYTIANNPVNLPSTEAPIPWTGWSKGGYRDPRRIHTSLLRSRHHETAASVRAAIKSGTMQPFLDALNALQAVPFTINHRVLEVMQQCIDQGIKVPGLQNVRPEDIEMPARQQAWEEMGEAEQRRWKYKVGRVKQAQRTMVADQLLLRQDMRTAELLAQHERWYTPCNADWRGRVYPMSHFNFQREDRVRALFLFAEGAPMTDEGMYWLKVHVANCGDFNKVSKRPFDERVQWTDQNAAVIQAIAANPLAERLWLKADKPFLFLAACLELASVKAGAALTHLPVSFDGSCSGLQHLCAMTRAPEGSLVNLTGSTTPQDVYQTVADRVIERVKADLDTENGGYAQMCLDYGIDRKLVKRNVMTFSYSSKKFGMSQQHVEDLMRPLAFKVLLGEHAEHPFGADEGRGAAKYLASHVYDAIGDIVSLPAQAMAFLQKCARALAHEGKPLEWTTPTGLPWSNRYHHVNVKRVVLWLQDVRVQVSVAEGDKKQIDKDRSSNGVAPNFVHALDAAHLMLTANAAAREGIAIATVHDSFGCLAPHATRFNAIIREEFVNMYQRHDVLAEVLERAHCDLTPSNSHRLPEVPIYGSLDIEEVRNAPFAFS
jgi:DNA-directed RNA polymerase